MFLMYNKNVQPTWNKSRHKKPYILKMLTMSLQNVKHVYENVHYVWKTYLLPIKMFTSYLKNVYLVFKK